MTFLNPGFPSLKRRQGETPQSGQPAERRQKSQAKMFPQPQMHRRIQADFNGRCVVDENGRGCLPSFHWGHEEPPGVARRAVIVWLEN